MTISHAPKPAALTLNTYLKQGSFWLIFAIITFEGLVYFGLRSFLVLFLTDGAENGGLGLSQENGLTVYGSFTTAAYIAMFCGGVLGDITKKYQHIIVASIVMMAASLVWLSQSNADNYFIPLIIIGCASGAIQVCLFTKLGQLVKQTPNFALNTFAGAEIATSIGAMFAPIVFGTSVEFYSYQFGFYLCIASVLLPLIFSLLYLRTTNSNNTHRHAEPIAPQRKLSSNPLKVLICIVTVLILDSAFWLIYEIINNTQYELIAQSDNQIMLYLLPSMGLLVLLIIGFGAFHHICKATMVNFAFIYMFMAISGYLAIQAIDANQPTNLLMLIGITTAIAEVLLTATSISLLCLYTDEKYLGSIIGLSFFITMLTNKAISTISELENILLLSTQVCIAIAAIIGVTFLLNRMSKQNH